MAAARIILNVFVTGSSLFGKAFIDAWRQAGIKAAQSGMRQLTIGEAEKILNLRQPYKLNDALQKYQHLFKANDPSNGGSFYLQSKVVRAKETIEHHIAQQGGR